METFLVSFPTPPLRWWDDYGGRDWLSVWVWSQGSVLGSDWPPRDFRHCGCRPGTEGERRLYARAPALACAAIQGIQFSSEFYCFSRRGLIGALVSGELWRTGWLCVVTAFHSCSALAQSGSCGSARSFTQMHATHVQGEVPEFGVSPWRITCIWQLGIVYCYV